MSAIPEEWIKKYVDDLLAFAAQLDERTSMRAACLLRADHVMDLVKAYRESRAGEVVDSPRSTVEGF